MSDVDEIGRRWKVRYDTQRAAAPSLACPPPPDTRASMLRLRAEILRSEPRLANTHTLEDELAATIEELVEARANAEELRQESQWLRDEVSKGQQRQEKEAQAAARVREELAAAQAQLAALQDENEKLRAAVAAEPRSSGGGSRRGSMRHMGATAAATGPRDEAGSADPAPTPPAARSSGHSSPLAAPASRSSFRSPKRYAPSPTRRSEASSQPIAAARTGSPAARPVFK